MTQFDEAGQREVTEPKFLRLYNEVAAALGGDDMELVLAQALKRASAEFPDLESTARREVIRHLRLRSAHEARLRRAASKKFEKALHLLQDYLALAEFINRRLSDSMGEALRGDADQSTHELLGLSGVVGGRALKGLLLILLQARAIALSGEIGGMLRSATATGLVLESVRCMN